MNILEKIASYKQKEVDERKSLYPVKLLEKSIYFETKPVSLKEYLLRNDKSGIIAEFKTRSPSKGDINTYAKAEKVSVDYMQAGASALSVLTDQHFFGGSFQNLTKARKYNYCPILQKDFILDEYKVVEAKSIGADAILLIAAILSKAEIHHLACFAKSLNLEVLFEVHDEMEIQKVSPHIDLIGVNNRNLQTFDVDIQNSVGLADKIPAELLKISESGIHSPDDIIKLKKTGFNGFLMGEYFMSTSDPGRACREFIQQIKNKEQNLKQLKNERHEIESLRIK